jgi:hypothetical protein
MDIEDVAGDSLRAERIKVARFFLKSKHVCSF